MPKKVNVMIGPLTVCFSNLVRPYKQLAAGEKVDWNDPLQKDAYLKGAKWSVSLLLPKTDEKEYKRLCDLVRKGILENDKLNEGQKEAALETAFDTSPKNKNCTIRDGDKILAKAKKEKAKEYPEYAGNWVIKVSSFNAIKANNTHTPAPLIFSRQKGANGKPIQILDDAEKERIIYPGCKALVHAFVYAYGGSDASASFKFDGGVQFYEDGEPLRDNNVFTADGEEFASGFEA